MTHTYGTNKGACGPPCLFRIVGLEARHYTKSGDRSPRSREKDVE